MKCGACGSTEGETKVGMDVTGKIISVAYIRVCDTCGVLTVTDSFQVVA